MIENISLDYLKTFYLVAKVGNITKVAEETFVSQSAITQTIQKLESKIGYTLLTRYKRGVKLTDVGQELFNKLDEAFLNLKSVDLYFENLNSVSVGELRISCGTNLSKRVLLSPLCEFLYDYPNISFKQFDKSNVESCEMLSNGKIDIFIAQKDENMAKKFNFLPILTEKYVFVCSKRYFENYYKNGQREYILQNKGSKSREIFDNYCKQNNVAVESKIEVDGYNMLIALCKKDKGIIMVPSYLVESEIKSNIFIEIGSDKMPQIEYFAYTNKVVKNKIIDTFLEYLKK